MKRRTSITGDALPIQLKPFQARVPPLQMDIIKLARKLQPLMPEQVAHWLRVRDAGDSEMRALIDQQIVSEAYQRLGDFRSKVLLSLPPAQQCKGAYNLGTVLYESPKGPFGLKSNELLQNMAIFGRSGAGKTNVTFHILRQLAQRGVPFLFLDWKRTARHLLPTLQARSNVYTPGRSLGPFPFNPFLAPPGLEYEVYVQHVIDVMADAYTLGDGVRSVLQKAVTNCYRRDNRAPDIDSLIREVEELPGKERVRGWKISALRALESLALAKVTGGATQSQENLARSLLDSNTIIELDALSQSSKKFLVPVLCLWLYYVRLAAETREKLSFVIVVEEAHHVLYRGASRSKESLMSMLLRQCREIGISMIVVDQHPHLISSAALGNAYTSICLNLKDPSDISRAAGISGVGEDEKWCFSRLPVGQAVVKLQDRWRRPFLVQFPLVAVKKGSVTDERLAGLLRRSGGGAGRQWADGAGFGPDGQVPTLDGGLSDESFAFLEDVLAFPDDGVKQRYHRLAMSVRRGQATRDQLVERGYLEMAFVKVGRSRKVILRVRRRARELLGIGAQPATQRHESLAHEFWKRFHADRLQREGYSVSLEAPRRGGRVDVLATKGAKHVAIEVETGNSDVVANVRNCLASKFDQVIVIATDEQAQTIVERQLAEAGLLITARVDVLLGGA